SLIYAAAMAVLAAPLSAWGGFAVLLVIGVGWMTTMTTLNATAQIYLPRRLRARGMSAYLMSFSCGMAIGSAFWGQLAEYFGLNIAFIAAAATMVVTALVSRTWPLGSLRA
ncbi:MAG: MFS transporter, partial [Aureliella sp.]